MIFKYDEAIEAEPVPGVRRRMLSCGNNIQIIEFFLPKGVKFPLHKHPHEQIGFIEKGRMRIRIADEVRDLHEGDGYCVPPDTEHATEALEDCIDIDVFSPIRQEYKDRLAR
jgi:quercetin dioxygenase-like cupin family protein